MISTTKMGLDKKGGILGIEELEGNKHRIQMYEEAQAKDAEKTYPGQLKRFYEMGLTEGEAGEQYFNTNIALINYSVLGPFLRELRELIGEEGFSEIITPDLMEKDITEGTRTFSNLEGALGSALLNLDAFIRTTDDRRVKELMDKHGIQKLLRIVNISAQQRDIFFTPIKVPFDYWFQEYSDHFRLDTRKWCLENLRPGHLPAVDEAFARDNKYYQDVQHCIDAFGRASTIDLDSLSINETAKVHLKDAILRGKVKIVSECPEIVDLNSPEARKQLSHPATGRISLENAIVTITKEGKARYLIEALKEAGMSCIEAKDITEKVFTGDISLKGEFLDVIALNEQAKEVTVSSIDRNIVHRYGLLHQTANAFIVTPDGEIIMQRRSHKKDLYPLYVSIYGGHLGTNATYEEAIAREIKEELLRISSDDYQLEGKLIFIKREIYLDPEGKNNEARKLFVYVPSERELEI